MAEDKKVEVPVSLLKEMQEQIANLEKKAADNEARSAGLEQLVASSAEAVGKLKEKKDFEPKFRTVRIRKYPIAGDYENMGYIIGWTNREAYEEVQNLGRGPEVINFIDVMFLGSEKTKDGKVKAEKIKLLDLLNKSEQVHCKVLETKKETKKVPTGEEIDISVFDPQHGLISTGEKIDGYYAYSDIEFKIQIPGVDEPIWIDSKFCN